MEIERKLEFKAGKLNYDMTTKKVTPDKSNGILQVEEKDGQKHFRWINVDSHQEEIDLMIFENDAHFQVLPKRNLLILWFDSFEDRYFFWLQDPKLKLQDVADQVQKFINGEEPPAKGPSFQPQKKQSSSDAQTPPTQVTAKPQPQAPKQPALNLDFIQSLTKKLQAKKVAEMGGQPLHLSDIANQEFIKFMQENYDEKFLQHLPEGQQKEEFFRNNLHSPQLQQAIEALDDALNTEDGIAIFHEMKLDPSFLQHFYGTQAFLRALEKWGKDNRK